VTDEEWPTLTCPSCQDVFPEPGGTVAVCDRCGTQVRPRSLGARPFMLDSNAYDPIVDDPALWELTVETCRSGRIELLLTHVQYDELCEIPQEERRNRAASIPFVIVATYGMILDTSKVGLTRLGEPDKVEAIRNNSHKHSRDALVAATAQHEGATLVTGDRRLSHRARQVGVEVWSPEEFADFRRTDVA
jgi:predicted nucleic acid-binding protein